MSLYKVTINLGRFQCRAVQSKHICLILPELFILRVKILKIFSIEIIIFTFASHSVSEASGPLVVGEFAITLAVTAVTVHMCQLCLLHGLHSSQIHLGLVTIHQVVFLQGTALAFLRSGNLESPALSLASFCFFLCSLFSHPVLEAGVTHLL